jgi:hypothetical protein
MKTREATWIFISDKRRMKKVVTCCYGSQNTKQSVKKKRKRPFRFFFRCIVRRVANQESKVSNVYMQYLLILLADNNSIAFIMKRIFVNRLIIQNQTLSNKVNPQI